MWVGGQSDVACFDGSRFYSMRDLGFPAATGATAIAEDSEGAIWIGSEVGVYRFQRGQLNKVASGWVTALAASSGAVLVAMGDAGQGRPQQPFLFTIRRDKQGWTADKVVQLAAGGLISIDHSSTLLIPYRNGWGEARLNDVAAWRADQNSPSSGTNPELVRPQDTYATVSAAYGLAQRTAQPTNARASQRQPSWRISAHPSSSACGRIPPGR